MYEYSLQRTWRYVEVQVHLYLVGSKAQETKKTKKIVYIPGTWYQVGSLPRTGITYENEYEVHCDVPRTCDQAFLLFVVVAVCCCCCAHLFIWR